MKRKTVWIAETNVDEVECSSKTEALRVEEIQAQHEKIAELEEFFRHYFKLYHGEEDQYDNYLYLCVDCGKKLFEYSCEWDGHRNGRGDLTNYDNGRMQLFDGWRCADCDKEIEELLLKMIQYYSDNKKKTFLNIKALDKTPDERDESGRRILLRLCEIVEFWHDMQTNK